jgi:hypothetical protein
LPKLTEIGTIKGIGRIYQQNFIDTYTRLAFTKVYDRKNGLVPPCRPV